MKAKNLKWRNEVKYFFTIMCTIFVLGIAFVAKPAEAATCNDPGLNAICVANCISANTAIIKQNICCGGCGIEVTDPVCGDGKCEKGEDEQSCSQDCKKDVKEEEQKPKDRQNVITAPCAYYGGARKPVDDCPPGCPNKKMSIVGKVCKCPNNMRFSSNKMKCVCPKGKVENNLRCVDKSMDCGRCLYLVKELLGKTRYCASKSEWHFDDEECPPCPEGTVSTGWRCMEMPKTCTEYSFFSWPPTFWDLFPWLIFLILLALHILGRVKDKDRINKALKKGMNDFVNSFKTHVAKPLEAKLNSRMGTMKTARVTELEYVIIPFLNTQLTQAKTDVKQAKTNIENFSEQPEPDEDDLVRMSYSPTMMADEADKDLRERETVDLDSARTRFEPRLADLQSKLRDSQGKVQKLEKEIKAREEEARDLGIKITRTYP